MQNMASETAQKKRNILPIIGVIVIIGLIIIIVVLSMGSKDKAIAYESTFAAITQIANTLTAESISMQEVITETPTVVIPTATEIIVEPTEIHATEISSASSNQDVSNIKMVCMDNYYDSTIRDYSSFDSTSSSYKENEIAGSIIQMNIPVLSCMVEVEFLQPISDDVKVALYQARDATAWYQKTLEPVSGKSNTYYAILDHHYVIAPPYWSLDYGFKIEGTDTVFWEGTLSLIRPFSGLCWEGSVPDPVTLKCPEGDRLEREPHPDMPTLVPGGLH